MKRLRHVVYHLMPDDWKETYTAACGQWLPLNVTSTREMVSCKRCLKALA